MKRVCVICHEVFGEKEPFDSDAETHGYCEICFPKELERLKTQLHGLKPNGDPSLPGREGPSDSDAE
jgi:hypothetical protein